jgi:chromosomal replication initiation ATPase DnaA
MNEADIVKKLIADCEANIKALTEKEVRLSIRFMQDKSINEAKELVKNCCEIWGIDAYELKYRTRKREAVIRRKILALVLKQRTLLTLKEIGYEIGYDHTNVIHAIKSCQDLIDTNDKIIEPFYAPIKYLFKNEAV